MKTQSFYVFFFMLNLTLYLSSAQAQKLSVTSQPSKTEEDIETDSWTAHLDQSVSEAQKSFSDFIETAFKLKTSKKAKGIYVVEKSKFIEISPMRIDIRAIFMAESSGSAVSFVFSPGYDIFFTTISYNDQYQKAQLFVNSYVRFHYTAHYNKIIADIGTKIKGNESEIKSEENKIDKLKSNIAENDEKINAGDPNGQKLKDRNAKSYKDIDEKNLEIERLRKEILRQQDEIIKANVCLKTVAEFK